METHRVTASNLLPPSQCNGHVCNYPVQKVAHDASYPCTDAPAHRRFLNHSLTSQMGAVTEGMGAVTASMEKFQFVD